MPSLKDLKNRIGSVKSTQKITSAMKMVAAAKLRKAQEQALASRPYTSLMDNIVSKIASKASGNSVDLLTGKFENKTHLLIVFSADRGLCGGFNGSITRTVRSEIKKLKSDGIEVKLLMVGKKSADALNRDFGDLFVEKIDGKSANPNYSDAEVLAKKIIDWVEGKKTLISAIQSEKPTCFVFGGDSMAHAMKGNIGLFISGGKDFYLNNICVTDIKNWSKDIGKLPNKVKIIYEKITNLKSRVPNSLTDLGGKEYNTLLTASENINFSKHKGGSTIINPPTLS